MSFIILDGIDRSGKTTIANYYESQGFEIVHMSAPDKKYSDPLYNGPTYYEDMIDMYTGYSDMDIVFDRSIYGELIWPQVYGRKPQLTKEEIIDLRQIEEKNDAKYILMSDPNIKAHWERCVANNEPLTREQFKTAHALYSALADGYGFFRTNLNEFKKQNNIEDLDRNTEEKKDTNTLQEKKKEVTSNISKTPEQLKLEQANVINNILSNRILKKKGFVYDKLEDEIKDFLNDKLKLIFGKPITGFNKQEVQILKLYCNRLTKKLGEK